MTQKDYLIRKRYTRKNILEKIKQQFRDPINTREDINSILLYVLDLKIILDTYIKEKLTEIIPEELKNYFDLAFREVQNHQLAERAKKRFTRISKLMKEQEVSEEFEDACKNYEKYKKYEPKTEEEAKILENIWRYKVIQYSNLVQYKNPVVYHIPMGGINK